MTKSNYYIMAIIPARSGSKSVPHKNIRPFAGKPLMAWSIEQARASALIDRVIVSTDSPRYARIAREYGAEVPFLRPAVYSRDRSSDLQVFQHALQWLKRKEGRVPDILVHLRPTTPFRTAALIDNVVRKLIENPEVDAVRTVAPSPFTPYKMWHMESSGLLKPLLRVKGLKDPWNQARQILPPTWVQTGTVDVVWSKTILRKHSMTGTRILGYVQHFWDDIDTETDFARAETRMKLFEALSPASKPTPRRICFDLDGVLADSPGNLNYAAARPRYEMIELTRLLKQRGHHIIVFTARGSLTGKDWRAVTERQLGRWGVMYDELIVGKPAADIYIDDRGVTPSDLRWAFEFARFNGLL